VNFDLFGNFKTFDKKTHLMKDNKYFENLDGWRFLCFLSVFFFHSFHTEVESIKSSPVYSFIKKDFFGNGNIGVNFFFVLSGFLITYLIIQEKNKTNKINVLAFWKRRILRIWPLYFFCVFFGFIIFPYIKQLFGQESMETASWPMYIGFLSNLDIIKNGLPDSSILGVLWSVAIEEQFYFVWPILLAIIPIRYFWTIFISILLLSIQFRYFNNSYMLHEHHTLSCIGDMAIGGLGAWLITNFAGFHKRIESMPKYSIFIIYITFILILFFRDEFLTANHFFKPFERIIIAGIMILIILEQNYSSKSLFKMSRFKLISNLGKITYGMYCLHFIGILITLKVTEKFGLNQELWQVLILETVVALFITIVISKISYKYFEMPFLLLKDKVYKDSN
jgi:peptidoglycan/LPS O-acetylase OafA/YrhL